jgi:hypothetical protein
MPSDLCPTPSFPSNPRCNIYTIGSSPRGLDGLLYWITHLHRPPSGKTYCSPSGRKIPDIWHFLPRHRCIKEPRPQGGAFENPKTISTAYHMHSSSEDHEVPIAHFFCLWEEHLSSRPQSRVFRCVFINNPWSIFFGRSQNPSCL